MDGTETEIFEALLQNKQVSLLTIIIIIFTLYLNAPNDTPRIDTSCAPVCKNP